MSELLHKSILVAAGIVLALVSAGCDSGPGPTPSDVCDFLEECYGPQQPGCEKSLVPIYKQASEAGCSAELAEQFDCAIDQGCDPGDDCLEESETLNECLGGAAF